MKECAKGIYYHYCSMDGFFGIINSKSIWLSSARASNDYMEERWFKKVLHDLLREKPEIREAPLFNDKYGFLNNEYIFLLPSYFFCLSELGDSLSQWRAYAENATGVSIGFDIEYFGIESMVPNAMVKFSSKSLGFGPVSYSESEQKNHIEGFFNLPYQNEGQVVMTGSIPMKVFGYFYKNSAFEEEKEWRIVHAPVQWESQESVIETPGSSSDLQFRCSNGKLIDYFTLSLNEERPVKPINRVVLGPKCKVERNMMREFLLAKGFGDVEVFSSKASYR